MADQLQEVDYDPFVGPVHLVEVDHDPFAQQQPQIPVITVHPRQPEPLGPMTVAQPSGGPQASAARINEGLDTARSTVLDFLTPESFKPQVSAETEADYHRRMSDYMRRDYVGKMDLPDIEPSMFKQAARGAVDASMLLGGPIEAGGLKLAAAGVPLLRRGLARGAEVAAPAIARGAERFVTPEGFARPSADYMKRAREIAEEIQSMGIGAGPLDLKRPRGPTSQLPPQTPLERYDPARGVSERMQAASVNPDVISGVDAAIKRGMGMGVGMDKWYHTYPMREAWIDTLRGDAGERSFREYMRNVSASSPKSDAVSNSRTGSYYYLMGGRDLPKDLPYPYGSMAQNLHRQNYGTIYGPGWDLIRNPKPPSFEQNLIENLRPVTGDTHAFRLPGILSGDPRFLETSAREVFKKGKTPSEFAREYGELKVDDQGRTVATYRPQKLFESGRLTPQAIRDIPAFWAAQPNPNEYAALERFWTERARKAGLAPAEGQSAGWAGGGEITGLETPATHTFPEIFNERTLFTSMMRHEKPEQSLRYLIRRKKPLLGIAGGAAAAPAIEDFLDQPR